MSVKLDGNVAATRVLVGVEIQIVAITAARLGERPLSDKLPAGLTSN
jgi:hypothetical protein